MNARSHSLSSSAVRRVRGEVCRRDFNRARRAIEAGFYLEAIALTESMLADRIEAILADLRGSRVQFRTVSEAARDLRSHPEYGESELLQAVTDWGHGRSRLIHEFAKASDQEHPSWRGRLKDAHQVAESGLQLLAEVTSESQRRRRRAGRESVDLLRQLSKPITMTASALLGLLIDDTARCVEDDVS